MNKELLWEKEKYQKQKSITINLELAKWGTKYYLAKHFLASKKNDRVLDIGCGYGTNLFLINKNIKNGVGIDISITAIKTARKLKKIFKATNLQFQIGNANKIVFSKNSFDKIICFDVAEHLIKPEQLFSEINRLLKPGGRALIYTNFYGKFCWGFIKEFIKRQGKLQSLWVRDKKVLHLNRFTRNQIEGYFQKNNLNYRLVFKNHWLTPIILDLASFLQKKEKVLVNQSILSVTNHVSFVSKIQYYLALLELKLFGNFPSEGVFILINKLS